MTYRWISRLLSLCIFLVSFSHAAVAQKAVPVSIKYEKNSIVINNKSDKDINLNKTKLRFNYFGRVFKITTEQQKASEVKFELQDMRQSGGNKVYTISFDSNQKNILPPNASLKLKLVTDKKDVPNNFQFLAPEPVNVTVSVRNTDWVEVISICNTSGKSIPLNNIEFDFNYSLPMPKNIWGSPWADWKVASQTGNQVVLIGGTPYTPELPSDPGCMNPLTIKFNASPSAPAPTGPFVFKAETGNTSLVGNLHISLGAAPDGTLPKPVITVAGSNTNLQKTLNWGTNWDVTNLPVGTYTVSGSTVSGGGQTYLTDPLNVQVQNQQTTNVTVSYHVTPTTAVTVHLINAPTAQVPLTLTGKNSTLTRTVTNGTVLNLAKDTYQVASNITGYSFVAMPNPLVVPNTADLNITYTPTNNGDAGSRKINFVNQCPFSVWFGFISGATPNKAGGETCVTDADCHPNNTCVDRGAGGKHCFWTNPVPADNNFKLAPNGGSNSVVIPFVTLPNGAVWSGAAAGRTNCTAAGCETGDCGGGEGGCPAGKGFKQPATQAEFTFQVSDSDYYDIEAVNGLNIPVAMAPINTPVNPNDPYSCGAPGATTPITNVGACTWNLNPNLVEYNWVRAGGSACTASSDCQNGTVCGLSFNPGKTPLLQKTCGKLLGYWNANQICGVQPNYGAPFNCQQQLPAPNNAFKVFQLLGCAPIPSCYQGNAQNNCCGCVNWDQVGVNVPPAPFTKQCVNKNDYWVSNVMPGLKWIKQACPTAYTYPFDDMSSTFMCKSMKDRQGTQVNSVDYTITFCPGGKTGGVS
ncbi:thaumatin family protein [Legionella sp. D16C41]|uniref:thaumatin family protein n=1 Tax=Legionella sp. D16C41 TaxID=3402688 RepID=UPI003AF8ACED